MKKRILIPAAVLVVLAAVYFLFFSGVEKKYDFRLDPVTRGDITMVVTATGTINAVTSVDVGTQVSGIISKLYADFNSVVKEGQVIAQIDPTFLQQAVKDAEASLERANAQFADSKRSLERTKSLYEKGLESQSNYDAATTTFESNQAALKQAQASLDRAKINLAYATIYAPISGVVINRAVNVGQTVAASFSSPTLYTIANDLRKMQVQATIDESDIGRISIGQEATFTVDAYPDDKFTGTVSQIRLAPVTIQNVVNYTVIIDVNNDQLKLMPGMTATVKIMVGSSKDVLRVSNLALRFQPPVDLVDTAKYGPMRQGRGMRRGMDGEGEGAMAQQMDPASNGGPNALAGGDRRQRFRAVRDSIVAAHGGKMSDEEVMGEMRKLFEARRAEQAPQPAPIAKAPAKKPERYGISNNFPEYEKSAYVPNTRATRGRVWILDKTGKLQPVFVVTGLTDGRYTEVTSNQLKAGDQLVLGASSANGSGAQSGNPLSGQPQRMGFR
jgi:HlyD family secretion protein